MDPGATPPGTPPPEVPADATPPAETPPPPPSVGPPLIAYRIVGELTDPEPTLRAVFDTILVLGEPWDAGKKNQIAKLAATLSYHVNVSTQTGARGIAVTLDMIPAAHIRHVEVKGNWPLFEDEILSRLNLRPGQILAPDVAPRPGAPTARQEQLDAETARLKTYLSRNGYFDARVVLAVIQEERNEYRLLVQIRLGERYEIGKVVIEGNTVFTDAQLRDKLKETATWEKVLEWFLLYDVGFSEERLRKDLDEIRRSYRRAGYFRARVTTRYAAETSIDRLSKTVNFVINVVEGRETEVLFQGVGGAVSEEDLRRVITFAEEGANDDFEVERSKAAMRDVYQKAGYYQAQIAHERVRLTETFERIVFLVDEGPRLAVKNISFTGNRAYDEATLRRRIRTREHPGRLAFLASGGYVTNLQLQQDVAALTQFYRNQGYAAARIDARVAMDRRLLDDIGALAAAVTSEESGGGLWIRFHVEEGPRDVVKSVALNGNKPPITDEMLMAKLLLRPGRPYTERAMQVDAEAIASLYKSKGYARATVSAEVRGQGDDVRVIYEIDQGEPTRIGKIIIRGNFHTSDWVIRDALGMKEGDLFTTERLETGQLALRTTDLFASVYPEFVGLRDGTGPVHIVVDVEERHDNSGEFEVGIGFSTDNSAFFQASYGLKNVGGIGASFVVQGEYGVDIRRLNLTATLPPWVLRRWVSVPLKLDLTARYRDEDDERFGNLVTRGFSLAFTRQLGKGIYWTVLKYDYSLFNRPEELTRPAGVLDEDDETPVETTTASLGTAITVDRRYDRKGNLNPLSPAKGFLLTGSFAFASEYLLGTDTFAKYSIGLATFFSIGRRVLITNGIRYDYGIPLGGATLLPEVERFTAGGDTTVRGYEQDHLATEVIREPLQPGGDVMAYRVIPAGGNIRIVHNLDLQVRVANLKGLPLASAIFLDTGYIANSFAGFTIEKPRHSIGVALLRLLTPFGSLSMEYAIPLDPQIGDDPTGRMHFNFGFVF